MVTGESTVVNVVCHCRWHIFASNLRQCKYGFNLLCYLGHAKVLDLNIKRAIQGTLKNVSNYLNTNIYADLETSGGRSSDLYLNVVHFLNTSAKYTPVTS
jgi:hypothetical protein